MKNQKFCIAVCAVIFLVGIAGSLWVMYRTHSQTVRITQNGNTLYIIDLETAEDQTIEVEYQGSKNVIQIADHQIFVAHADCPDQTCVNMGALSSGAAPIVCLPNKLVIEFTEKDEIDAEVR